MKKILYRILSAAIILICLCLPLQCRAAENNRSIMAYNIYLHPDLSGAGRKFEGYVIDFYGEKTPQLTYWALCNWQMDLQTFLRDHPGAHGMGAYAGLQNTADGRKGLLSFWEILDKSGKTLLRAKRIYPAGSESTFDGEGEGTNHFISYDWKTGHWYRMMIRSWKDEESGHTFVGQWLCDTGTGAWTLASYFDTGLTDSFITGDLALFQENYNGTNRDQERKFRVRGLYALPLGSEKWVSLGKAELSRDTVFGNKEGRYAFGAEQDYFWGSAGGRVKDQAAFEKANPSKAKFSITQAAAPSMPAFTLKSLSSEGGKITFAFSEKSAPMLRAEAEFLPVKGSSGEKQTIRMTRPEKKEIPLTGIRAGNYTVKLTFTDIFGQTLEEERKIRVGSGKTALSGKSGTKAEAAASVQDQTIDLNSLKGETIRKLLLAHYTREFEPAGEYEILPEEFHYTDRGIEAVLRYLMTDEEAEELLANGSFPVANKYITDITVSLSTGKVTDLYAEGEGGRGPWYLQDEPDFAQLARADGAIRTGSDKASIAQSGTIISKSSLTVGNKRFSELMEEDVLNLYGRNTFYQENRTDFRGETLSEVHNTLNNRPDMYVVAKSLPESGKVVYLELYAKDQRAIVKSDTRVEDFYLGESLEDMALSLGLPEDFEERILFEIGEDMDVVIRPPVEGETGDYVFYAGNVDKGQRLLRIIDDDVQLECSYYQNQLRSLIIYDLDYYKTSS